MTRTSINSNLNEFERLFLSLGDKTRLRLLSMMAAGPVSVGFLADELGESQPKVSRHLAYLRNAGVVSTRRDGKWIYYGIQPSEDEAVNRVMGLVIETLSGAEITPAQISLPMQESNADSPRDAEVVQESDMVSDIDHATVSIDEDETYAPEDTSDVHDFDNDRYEGESDEVATAQEDLEVFLL